MKKLIALAGAAILGVTLVAAPPAQAGPKEQRFMLSLMKTVWTELDSSDRSDICAAWRISKRYWENYMASEMHEAFDYEFSLSDTRKATQRLLRWAC